MTAIDTSALEMPPPPDAVWELAPRVPMALGGPAPAGLVTRPSLVGRLVEARAARLALVVAPPGYGKSSLIEEWSQWDDRPFVWVSPGPRSDDVGPLIAEACERYEDGVVIVIDPGESLRPASLRALVRAAAADPSSDVQIAVASRTEPDLPLGRLRAHRQLVEVRTTDLAMGAVEAAALLRAEGFDPSPDELERLVADVEGWPAALFLATLAAREAADEHVLIDGTHHLLADYISDEVLSELPEDLRRFAVRTSPLEELSGLGCDAVLGQRGTAPNLIGLTRMSPLLAPLDPSHQVFRWHPVVRDALRSELRRCEPELEAELHARASRWYVRRGDTDRALGHAAAAGDAGFVAGLLGCNALEYLSHGRRRLVDGWLNTLDAGVVAEHAVLALCAAVAALCTGQAEQARKWSEAGLGAKGDGSPEAAAGLTMVAAIAGASRAGVLGEVAEDAGARLGPGSSWRPYAMLLEGISRHLTGEAAQGADLLDRAIGAIGDRAPGVTALGLAQRTMVAIECEEWELAAELSDQARSLLVEWNLEREPLSALVFAAAAVARAHQGRADEAKADLRRGLHLLTVLGEFRPWYGAETRILLAHAALLLTDVVRSRALLAEASRLARKVPDAVAFRHWFDTAWARMDTLAEASLSGPSSLTIAELRVLRFLPSHRSFREIGTQLNVSGNTVKTQAHAIYRKLGVASRSEAVQRATEAGILGQ